MYEVTGGWGFTLVRHLGMLRTVCSCWRPGRLLESYVRSIRSTVKDVERSKRTSAGIYQVDSRSIGSRAIHHRTSMWNTMRAVGEFHRIHLAFFERRMLTMLTQMSRTGRDQSLPSTSIQRHHSLPPRHMKHWSASKHSV